MFLDHESVMFLKSFQLKLTVINLSDQARVIVYARLKSLISKALQMFHLCKITS